MNSIPTPRRPFSIIRRMLVVVVGVSVLALALHLVSLFLLVRPVLDEITVRLLSQIQTVELALLAVPPAQRDALAAAIGTDMVTVSRTRPLPSNSARNVRRALPPNAIERLEAGTGRHLEAFVVQDQGGEVKVAIDVPVGNERWWLTLTSRRPSLASALLTILGSVALIGVAAGLALFFGIRHVTVPMLKLADDMLARRNQLRKIDEPPRVSVELQGIIRSFNALVSAVQLSERARHDLLAGVSHDLRTPLARLRLRAETECPDDVAAKMEVDFLALSRIIDQFLAFAQGQNGVAIGQSCPLSELVDAVVGQYRADGVDVRHAGADPIADPIALQVPDIGMQRVLVNLIDNARAHGRGVIEVELAADGAEVMLMVFDEGPGIAAAAFEQVLQPFVRGQPERAAEGHCGLGLAIVAQVAEQLGGRPVLSPFDGRRAGVGVALPR